MTSSDQLRTLWRFPAVGAFAAAAIVAGGYACHVTAEIASAFRAGAASVIAHDWRGARP